jgi:hemicentin
VPPGVSLVPSSDTVVMVEGEFFTLNCTATGCPTPNVTWTKNGVTASLQSGSTYVLLHPFASLTKEDTGTYQCAVNNGVGSPISKTIYLNVTCKIKKRLFGGKSY